MSEPSKRKAPNAMGGYGQGTKGSSRSRIMMRNAKNPVGFRRAVVPVYKLNRMK